jgi:hypothetical protein
VAHPSDVSTVTGLQLFEVGQYDTPRILQAYALLCDVMGPGNVEDIDSFVRTVSAYTDDAVFPRLVCAAFDGRIQGVVLGAYLSNLGIGMILYSAVRAPFRRRGVYSLLRSRLIALLKSTATRGKVAESEERGIRMQYLISELEPDSELSRTYAGRWGAYVAPCDYEQPAVQGLRARKMDLVFQPIVAHSPPTRDQIALAVREIYQRVYRIGDVERNVQFRRVVESLQADAGPGQGAQTT